MATPNVPSPFPSRTQTELEWFANTRSGRPSALRSAIATERGTPPVPKSVLAPNVPSPFPSSTEIVPVSARSSPRTTAKSGRPSALRSTIANEKEPLPMSMSVLLPNVPSPFPSSTETVFEPQFAVARSGRPSALRSATATNRGWSPVSKSLLVPNVPSPFPSRTETVLE